MHSRPCEVIRALAWRILLQYLSHYVLQVVRWHMIAKDSSCVEIGSTHSELARYLGSLIREHVFATARTPKSPATPQRCDSSALWTLSLPALDAGYET